MVEFNIDFDRYSQDVLSDEDKVELNRIFMDLLVKTIKFDDKEMIFEMIDNAKKILEFTRKPIPIEFLIEISSFDSGISDSVLVFFL